MKKITAHLIVFFLVCISFVPFLNTMRYAPMPDFVTNASVVFLVAMAGFTSLYWQIFHRNNAVKLPIFAALGMTWWVMVFLPCAFFRNEILPISEMTAILVAMYAAVIFYSLNFHFSRISLVTALALAILFGGLLQSFIALLQLFQLASKAAGLLMYTERNDIIGNIAQRNQLAHVLTWSGLAAIYLWDAEKIKYWLVIILLMYFSIVIAWTSGRLPVAYALAFLCFSAFYFITGSQKRSGIGLVFFAISILLMQWIAPLLSEYIVSRELHSGLNRLVTESFSTRRIVEWQKSLLIVKSYPWFGIGFGDWPYYSTWLEAFGGLAKSPQNSLFTHSHSLFFQLLAETGWPATIFATVSIIYCLFPYLKKINHSSDNVFLLMIAVVILIHSMFEYPLWYLPFLVVFFFVLVLSPQREVRFEFREVFKFGINFIFVVSAGLYLFFGCVSYRAIIESQSPSSDGKMNAKNVDELLSVSKNPFFVLEAQLAISNYLIPSRGDVDIKLRHYEELVRYRPYPALLTNLAILRALAADPEGAKDAMKMAIAAYPASLPTMFLVLAQHRESEIVPLKQMVAPALELFQKHGAKAAAESVASSHLDRPLP